MFTISLIWLSCFFTGTAHVEPVEDCKNLDITYTTEPASDPQQTKILISVKGGKQPYYYFFFDAKKNPLTWDFEKSYYVAKKNAFPASVKVVDAEGCIRKIDLNERVK